MTNNERIRAIIYLSGERQIEQKMLCQMYALENSYEVLYDTNDIEEVKYCDVMLVANSSKVLRIEKEHHETIKDLKNKGVKIEVAVNEKNAGRYIDLITRGIGKNKLK